MSPEYLAGFFDGEGCINISVSGANRNYILRLMLVNTDYEFLEEIRAVYGGRLSRRLNNGKPHWKPFCMLRWDNALAEGLLRTLAPYLRLKKEQASLALRFRECLRRPSRTGRDRCLTGNALWEGELFKEEMHDLNRKGLRVVK